MVIDDKPNDKDSGKVMINSERQVAVGEHTWWGD